MHIIHSDSLKHALSVCNLFKYSLVSLNVEMHTYCYRQTHKACRAGLKGWYTAALLIPVGMLNCVVKKPWHANGKCVHTQTNTCSQTSSRFHADVFLCVKRIPNCAIRGPVDAFNPKGSRCRLPNCVWSCQLFFFKGMCLVSNHPADKDIF